MNTSEQINELAAALAKAQGEMQGASKDSANPFFKSKYADFASVRAACLPALTKHGIAVVQSPEIVNEVNVTVETRLIHSSGQWIAGTVQCAAKDNSPQAIGSAITYLRRYALQSFAGVAAEDDDGEAAQGRGTGHVMPMKSSKPAGYDDWLLDLRATADEGEDALKAAWEASDKARRAYLLADDPSAWTKIKNSARPTLAPAGHR